MSKYDLPPLGMMIPGIGLMLAVAAMLIGDLWLTYEQSMELSKIMMPIALLLLMAVAVGFVFAMAKKTDDSVR